MERSIEDDVEVLVYAKDEDVDRKVQKSVDYLGDPELVVDHFLAVIRNIREYYPRNDADFNRYVLIAKAVMRRLLSTGIDETAQVDRFVITLMTQRLIYDSYLQTLTKLEFYRINPIVLVDFNAHERSPEAVKVFKSFLEKFPARDIRDTVKEIVEMAHGSAEKVAKYLRSMTIFGDYYPETEECYDRNRLAERTLAVLGHLRQGSYVSQAVCPSLRPFLTVVILYLN